MTPRLRSAGLRARLARRRKAANVAGQAYALTIITPIHSERLDELRERLEKLEAGPASPLARLPGTHFGRWVIIDQLVYQGPPQIRDTLHSPQLLFTSNFDGPLARYLHAIRTEIPEVVEAIWGCCVGYPGLENPPAFERYLLHNQIDTSLFVAAYPHATVPTVHRSLALREELIRFAEHTQDMEDADLHAAYRERLDPSRATRG